VTRTDLLEFMRGHTYAVQASVSPSLAPQAAVVGVVVTDRFELFFDTIDVSRKVRNLRPNSKVAFVMWTGERTVQYEGVADEPQGRELECLKELYFERFPEGRDRQNWPGVTYVRAQPVWIRYSDFDQRPPLVVEFNKNELRTKTLL
jgi:pyridoxamine 5'-phosphate oxidase-like protein